MPRRRIEVGDRVEIIDGHLIGLRGTVREITHAMFDDWFRIDLDQPTATSVAYKLTRELRLLEDPEPTTP